MTRGRAIATSLLLLPVPLTLYRSDDPKPGERALKGTLSGTGLHPGLIVVELAGQQQQRRGPERVLWPYTSKI